jgi:hypothetical protein
MKMLLHFLDVAGGGSADSRRKRRAARLNLLAPPVQIMLPTPSKQFPAEPVPSDFFSVSPGRAGAAGAAPRVRKAAFSLPRNNARENGMEAGARCREGAGVLIFDRAKKWNSLLKCRLVEACGCVSAGSFEDVATLGFGLLAMAGTWIWFAIAKGFGL